MSKHTHAHLADQEKREKLLPSKQILTNFNIELGQVIADLGCGYGHFAIRAANMVGPSGRIKAIDIEPERLDTLRQRASEQGVIDRIDTILAVGETIPLPDQSVQVALIANVLHELQEPQAYLKIVHRILQNPGQLWIVEWVKKEMEFGPPMAERLSSQEWSKLLTEAGFVNIWVQDFSSTHVLIKAQNQPS